MLTKLIYLHSWKLHKKKLTFIELSDLEFNKNESVEGKKSWIWLGFNFLLKDNNVKATLLKSRKHIIFLPFIWPLTFSTFEDQLYATTQITCQLSKCEQTEGYNVRNPKILPHSQHIKLYSNELENPHWKDNAAYHAVHNSECALTHILWLSFVPNIINCTCTYSNQDNNQKAPIHLHISLMKKHRWHVLRFQLQKARFIYFVSSNIFFFAILYRSLNKYLQLHKNNVSLILIQYFVPDKRKSSAHYGRPLCTCWPQSNSHFFPFKLNFHIFQRLHVLIITWHLHLFLGY